MSRTLLVTVDSLRRDHLRHMYGTRQFVDDVHERAFATFPETFGSFPAIVGGRYAVERGLPAGASVAASFPGRAVGITTNHLLSPGYNYDEGFDEFASPSAGGEGLAGRVSDAVEIGGTAYAVAAAGWNAANRALSLVRRPGRTFREARDVVEAFLDAVDGHEEWFGWLHFMEVHHPYEPDGAPMPRVRAQNLSRRALAGRLPERHAADVRDLYRREVEELDLELRRLWEALPPDVEVLFTADHGELLGHPEEDGVWGHPGLLHPNLLSVPFATRNLDVPAGDVVSLVDVPAILTGADHGEGDLDRETAFAIYGDARAATDGDQLVATAAAAGGSDRAGGSRSGVGSGSDGGSPSGGGSGSGGRSGSNGETAAGGEPPSGGESGSSYRAWSLPDVAPAEPDPELVSAIESFSLEGGLTRSDADEATLRALGYVE